MVWLITVVLAFCFNPQGVTIPTSLFTWCLACDFTISLLHSQLAFAREVFLHP